MASFSSIGNKTCLFFLLFVPLITFAQDVKVVRSERIAVGLSGPLTSSAISPDGTSLLITGEGFRGLFLYDMRNGTSKSISSDPGAGYKPVFSSRGDKIWYRSDEYSGMMKYSKMIEYDLPSEKSRVVQEKSRNLSPPIVVNDRLVYSVEGKRIKNSQGLKSADEGVYVVLEDLVPVIYINGIGKKLKPNGEGNYIWVSLSPDRTRLLYNFQGTSAWVCDLEGKIIASAGRINSPGWINNDLIVGMNDRDDGYKVLSSDIVCYSLKSGKTFLLTDTKDKIEMYPIPFPDGKRIVYQNINGELYLMHITIR
jgi:Tol biopolymer transport system component